MRPSRVLLAALGAAQVAYGQVPGERGPAVDARARRADARRRRPPRRSRRAGRGAGPARSPPRARSASRAELVGVATGRPFGAYAYSGKLGPRVGGVPLLAAAAWAMMARPAWVAAGTLTARRAPRVALAAGALTAWDVFLDPRMAREGYWTWPDGGALRGRAGVELPRLVGHGAGRLRGLVGARTTRRRTRATTARSRCTRGPGWARRSRTPCCGGARAWRRRARPRWARSPCRRCGGGSDEGRRRRRGGRRAGDRASGSRRPATPSPCWRRARPRAGSAGA